MNNIKEYATPELYLEFCSSGDSRYREIRERHYVKNKGVHAQQIHFLIWYKGGIVGIISGSSAVYASPPRDRFFGIAGMKPKDREAVLRGIINNIVFRLEVSEKNLSTRVLSMWRKVASKVWQDIYGVSVYGFETLVIEDRTKIMEGGFGSEPGDDIGEFDGDFKKSPGTLYKADNWTFAGITEGHTKHHNDKGLNESYEIVAVFRKNFWCIWNNGHTKPVVSEGEPTWQANKKWSETLERRLRRRYPDITEEKWGVMSKDLKALAKGMTERRKKLIRKKLYTRGNRVISWDITDTT